MKLYLANGKYWQTLITPAPVPAAIAIGPWVFVPEGNHYRAVADNATVDAESVYSGPVSYSGEDGIADL